MLISSSKMSFSATRSSIFPACPVRAVRGVDSVEVGMVGGGVGLGEGLGVGLAVVGVAVGLTVGSIEGKADQYGSEGISVGDTVGVSGGSTIWYWRTPLKARGEKTSPQGYLMPMPTNRSRSSLPAKTAPSSSCSE